MSLKRTTPLRQKTQMQRHAPMRQRSALKSSGKRMPARRSTPRATKTMYRNRALLDLAHGKACLLQIPDVCIGGTETTVACHSNQARHGKAGWLKAHDWAAAWGCSAATPASTRTPPARPMTRRWPYGKRDSSGRAWR